MIFKIGRKPTIDYNVIFSILEKNKSTIFDNNCSLRPPSHKIWNDMCEELGNVITNKTLYIIVFQDRHSFKTKFKKRLGIDDLEVNDDCDSDTDSFD